MRGSTASHTRPRLTTVALVALVAAVNGARVGMLWPRLWGLSAAQEEAGCSSRPAHPGSQLPLFPGSSSTPAPSVPRRAGTAGGESVGSDGSISQSVPIIVGPAGMDTAGCGASASPCRSLKCVHRSSRFRNSHPSSFDQRFVSATPFLVSGTLWRLLGLAATPPLPPSSSRCCLARTARPAAAST
jgi:hypothetical protein